MRHSRVELTFVSRAIWKGDEALFIVVKTGSCLPLFSGWTLSNVVYSFLILIFA